MEPAFAWTFFACDARYYLVGSVESPRSCVDPLVVPRLWWRCPLGDEPLLFFTLFMADTVAPKGRSMDRFALFVGGGQPALASALVGLLAPTSPWGLAFGAGVFVERSCVLCGGCPLDVDT